MKTNPDWPVLITIITWNFYFQPRSVGILHLKGRYSAGSESHSTCCSHCYIAWCPLTTGIVASLCLLSRDAECVMHRPNRSRYLNAVKAILTLWNMFTINMRTSFKLKLFIWPQWAYEAHWNGDSDCYGSYGTSARLYYTCDCLMPGICSLTRPIAMVQLMSFRAEIHTVMW